jgi:viroplasmin and RNaseH domain-containing protein
MRTLYFNSDEEAESYMEDKIKAIAEKYQIPYIEIETE